MPQPPSFQRYLMCVCMYVHMWVHMCVIGRGFCVVMQAKISLKNRLPGFCFTGVVHSVFGRAPYGPSDPESNSVKGHTQLLQAGSIVVCVCGRVGPFSISLRHGTGLCVFTPNWLLAMVTNAPTYWYATELPDA